MSNKDMLLLTPNPGIWVLESLMTAQAAECVDKRTVSAGDGASTPIGFQLTVRSYWRASQRGPVDDPYVRRRMAATRRSQVLLQQDRSQDSHLTRKQQLVKWSWTSCLCKRLICIGS